MQLHFIANAGVPCASGCTLAVLDPSGGQPLDALQRSSAQDIDQAVRAARRCLDTVWQQTSAPERGRLLMRLSAEVLEHGDALALLEQRDCGKPTRQARADAQALARCLEFYAGACDKLHGQTIPSPDGFIALTWREPHGVTGHIVPWNHPMQIFARSVGAALAAGNACVVKPSQDAGLSLLRVAQQAAEAGFAAGAINIVTGHGHGVGDALARHPGIAPISFTGSAPVGTLVQQAAAERPCPVTLELGGKSPQLVFADADLDAVVPAAINAIVQNAGQTCSAGLRLLVERAVYEPLLERLGHAFETLRMDLDLDLDLDLGPLIRQGQQQRVWDFLSDAQVAGIPMVAQGAIVDEAPKSGFYQAPTLLRGVPPEHRLAQQEIFGPVLCAMAFGGEDEAAALANGTPSGLVAGVWSRDNGRQFRMARRTAGGQVFIHHHGAGGSAKSSGHGREKGFEGLYGFTTLKTVSIRHGCRRGARPCPGRFTWVNPLLRRPHAATPPWRATARQQAVEPGFFYLTFHFKDLFPMPLSPSAPRTLEHTRRVVYRGYARADGLWDIEGELLDSKPRPTASLTGGPDQPADAPIHSMAIRATVNLDLVVQAIEASMDAFPLGDCPRARAALQSMVGCTMSRCWRRAIEAHLGGVASCTHLRELLNNMATAAFQTVSKALSGTWPADRVPPYVGQCAGWDWEGEGVRVHHPQFFGRSDLAKATKPAAGPVATQGSPNNPAPSDAPVRTAP